MHHHVHLVIIMDTLMREKNRAYAKIGQKNLMGTPVPEKSIIGVLSQHEDRCRKGREERERVGMDRVKAWLRPWWSQGLFPSLSQLQINPFIKKSSRAHWKLPKETVWGWSKNKLSFRCYIIWLISANNCVIISHVLRAVIGGQNDEDQVLWFDWVSKPKKHS